MEINNNKRIAKNTLMLYSRQILILLVGLYSVRVVLNVLGVEDYGIFNVVGGVVAVFSFLSGSMASATQRFFSFSLGEHDIEKLKKTFSVNLLIYLSIALIAFFLLETIGTWFINQQLKISPERLDSAKIVFQISILTFITTILSSPFMAIIIAHEDMHIYAYVSIVEAVLKLGIIFLLMYISYDELKVYGILLFSVSFINAFIYISICIKKYEECQFRKLYWDDILLKQIISFTGWTLFGQLTSVLRNQAVTILLNQFFTPVVVAARAIAINITNKVNVFSVNFNMGLYPPIIKSYAAKDNENMFTLIFTGCKITFFLMWVFGLPFFIEMDSILRLWLKNPPEGAVLFTRLALVEVLINSISLPITTAARAPGKMKFYELILGCFQIAIFFIDLGVLMFGGEAYSVFIVAIIMNLVMFIVRLKIVKNLIGISLSSFIKQVLFPVIVIIFLSSIFTILVHYFLPKELIYTLLVVVLSVCVSSISMFYIGLNKQWRKKIQHIIFSRIHK